MPWLFGVATEAATVGAALLGLPVLGSPLEPLIGRVARFGMEQAVSPDSDLSADRQAVSLTRFPPGLCRLRGPRSTSE